MSSIIIKTPSEIEKMRSAGRLAAEVLEMIAPHVKVGVTTNQLDKIAHDYIVNEQKAIPKTICTSINHQVCHGMPSDRILREGDLLNIDVTVIKENYHGDTSKMFFVGKPSILAQRLSQVTQECLYRAIRLVKPGAYLGDLGACIQKYAESEGFSVVREYCGHGIGRLFHEDLQILHYGQAGTGIQLIPGMTFTIEPMINAGKRFIKLMPDQWTVVTKDHSLSAQWEHTLLVTETAYEVFTKRAEEQTLI